MNNVHDIEVTNNINERANHKKTNHTNSSKQQQN